MTRYQLALCHLQFGTCLSLFSRIEGLANMFWTLFSCASIKHYTINSVGHSAEFPTSIALKLASLFEKFLYLLSYFQVCPQPCDKMLVYFGFPFFASTKKQRGYVKIYMKRMVKEIEDHQDYTMLR